ncbi:MAG: hypothetical protein HeimC3_32110 [Candidatus Heimdallarchaeota archaeon LC_3]|nr:MAG: hypothetical protein HeimC3_32110 [Candidatus Heimdallarchaeota archaeon LC_3]
MENNKNNPELKSKSFICFHCSTLAQMEWEKLGIKDEEDYFSSYTNLWLAECVNCKEFSIWYKKKVLFPDYVSLQTPEPDEDLPDDLKVDFEEARKIVNDSPRGASALLRLVIQKLMKHLGEKGNNINEDIGNLVKNGLDPEVQKASDIIRVIGNQSVHPGQIDISDDSDTAKKLFLIINYVVKTMISPKKIIKKFYDNLPESNLNQINKRDNN